VTVCKFLLLLLCGFRVARNPFFEIAVLLCCPIPSSRNGRIRYRCKRIARVGKLQFQRSAATGAGHGSEFLPCLKAFGLQAVQIPDLRRREIHWLLLLAEPHKGIDHGRRTVGSDASDPPGVACRRDSRGLVPPRRVDNVGDSLGNSPSSLLPCDCSSIVINIAKRRMELWAGTFAFDSRQPRCTS
jgi:hypothetical protein